MSAALLTRVLCFAELTGFIRPIFNTVLPLIRPIFNTVHALHTRLMCFADLTLLTHGSSHRERALPHFTFLTSSTSLYFSDELYLTLLC
jgi:hypothetical protein